MQISLGWYIKADLTVVQTKQIIKLLLFTARIVAGYLWLMHAKAPGKRSIFFIDGPTKFANLVSPPYMRICVSFCLAYMSKVTQKPMLELLLQWGMRTAKR